MPGTHANQPAKTGTATTDTGGKAITDTLKTPGTSHGMSKAKGIGPSTNGDVRSMQEALKSQGHDPGPIDGMMGPQTQAALKDFQKAQNLEMTGHGDSQTLDKLGVKK